MIQKKIAAVRRWFCVHQEAWRNTLIVVLVTGILVQGGLLWSRVLTRDSIPWSGLRMRVTASAKDATETDNEAAAMPIRFAVRSADGMYGIQYNTEGLRTAYEETADIWAQALEHAKEPAAASAADYRTALQGELLLMEYDGSVPMDLIAGWLDCTLQDELTEIRIGTVALCKNETGGYMLYLRDSTSESLYCAQTQLEEEAFDAATQQFTPNDCVLAADEENTAVSPDLLYFRESETFDVLSFGAYDGSAIDVILQAFGMDTTAAQDSAYTMADGVRVYISGTNTLRMLYDGSVQYDGTRVRLTSHGHDRLIECVQIGYELTAAALGALDSGAVPVLTNAYTDADSGRYVAVYGIQVNGVPVDNQVTGYFARYEFEGDTMVHADLALRTCQTTGETIAVMPERQAAASLTGQTDAALSLRYIDSAKGAASEWESNLHDDGADAALWDAENIDDGTADTELNTAWYDSAGEPVSPQWYILRYDDGSGLERIVRTLSPEDIIVVRADFDRLIQRGGAT